MLCAVVVDGDKFVVGEVNWPGLEGSKYQAMELGDWLKISAGFFCV
jgi:hypothetical protein